MPLLLLLRRLQEVLLYLPLSNTLHGMLSRVVSLSHDSSHSTRQAACAMRCLPLGCCIVQCFVVPSFPRLQDTYALATYASSQGRLNETQALNHIHKNQDFHGPFHTPGSALFEDFCKDAIHRYCLDDIITQDKVSKLLLQRWTYVAGAISCK